MESSMVFNPVGTLRHKPGFRDLASKRRSGLPPLIKEEVDDKKTNKSETQAPSPTPSPPKRRPIARLCHSLSNLDVSQKVKSVVGKKRTRDEEDDEELLLNPPRPRKRPAVEQAFWNEYRAVRDEHNASEAMHAASRLAHAYDEDRGLDREPPHVNYEALALLEGREVRRDSSGVLLGQWSWTVARRFVDRFAFGREVQAVDFSWAGEEVEDFRLFVRAAEEDWGRERL